VDEAAVEMEAALEEALGGKIETGTPLCCCTLQSEPALNVRLCIRTMCTLGTMQSLSQYISLRSQFHCREDM